MSWKAAPPRRDRTVNYKRCSFGGYEAEMLSVGFFWSEWSSTFQGFIVGCGLPLCFLSIPFQQRSVVRNLFTSR